MVHLRRAAAVCLPDPDAPGHRPGDRCPVPDPKTDGTSGGAGQTAVRQLPNAHLPVRDGLPIVSPSQFRAGGDWVFGNVAAVFNLEHCQSSIPTDGKEALRTVREPTACPPAF